jgi:hypothetical protein
MTGFGNSPPRGRRAAPRTEARLAIELSVDGTAHSVTLNEVSRTGAKLSGASLFTAGQEIKFRAGTVQAVGEIIWCEGSECAIAFDTPIAAAEVTDLQSLAKFVDGVSHKKP